MLPGVFTCRLVLVAQPSWALAAARRGSDGDIALVETLATCPEGGRPDCVCSGLSL